MTAALRSLSRCRPFQREWFTGNVVSMSDAVQPHRRPQGLNSLPPRRTAEEIATHPPIKNLDTLVIDDLTDAEYQAFLDALDL